MSNLSQILADSNWGQESARINQNFQNLNADLEKVKSATTKFKGYFTSETGLKSKYPSPQVGDTAWVGETYPGTVYDVQVAGSWHNTGKAPDTGSVDLQDYAKKAELTELEGQLGSLEEKVEGIGEVDLSGLENKTSSIGYVTCNTAAGTAAKVLTVEGLTTLSTGIRLLVKMTYNNTAGNATLNINSLGAKPLYYNNTRVSGDNAWEAGEIVDIYYDGTNFYSGNFQGGSGTGGIGYAVSTTASGTATKTVTIAGLKELSTAIRILIKMSNNNTASNVNLNINNLGLKPLYYNGTRVSGDNSWEAGEVIDVFYDGTNFYSSNVQGGNSNGTGGNTILEWNTDVATTRKQIKQADRKEGLIICYKNADGKWVNEQYVGTSFSDIAWSNDSSWQKLLSKNDVKFSSLIVEWNTDVQTTRLQVTSADRKEGLIISYKNADGKWINEQYIGTSFSDGYWKGDSSWQKIPDKTDLDNQNNQIENYGNILGIKSNETSLTFEQGSIGNTGGLSTDTTSVRSLPFKQANIIKCNNANFTLYLCYYKNGAFVKKTSLGTGVLSFSLDYPVSEYDEYRLVVKLKNSASLAPEDIQPDDVVLITSDLIKSLDERILKNASDIVDLSLYTSAILPEIKKGNISIENSIQAGVTNRAYTPEYFDLSKESVIIIPDGVKISFRYYKSSGEFVPQEKEEWISKQTLIVKQYEGLVRMVLAYDDNRVVDPSALSISLQSKISNVKYNEKDMQQKVNTSNSTPVLKAILDRTWDDGTIKSQAYLWHDTDSNFYMSNSKDGYRQYLFTWTLDQEPYAYSMAILQNGDILAIYRTEMKSSGSDDSIRQNPIIFQKSNNYKPLEVDFGENLKPSAWLQNCGFQNVYKGEFFMFSEYARPSITKACIWKVTGDYTVADNWKIVLEKELSGQINQGFKHFHCVQYDPYTGIIYAASGDDDTAAAVYVSKDNGDTFELLHGPNEKECRLLNFAFTKDKVYWASDSGYENKHFLFSVDRGEDGVINYSTLQELHKFELVGSYSGVATYSTCYIPAINCLLFLDRADTICDSMPLFVYNITSKEVIQVDTINFFNERYGGFRTECSQLYTTDNSIIVGFGYTTFEISDNRNNMKLLGNTDTDCNIRNMVIRLFKEGNTFTVTYDTIS